MAAETPVRMGKLAVSATAGDVLVTIGLGSCIGLVIADRRARVAGLAHVMLPAATGGGKGRTVKVHLDGLRVVVKEAAGAEQTLLELR